MANFSEALNEVNSRLVKTKGNMSKIDIIRPLVHALLDDIESHRKHKEAHGWGPYFYGLHAMTPDFKIHPSNFILAVSTGINVPNGDLNRNTINRYRQKVLRSLKTNLE